ncbi:MAG: SseB family protein [Clostridiales bacterium]|nr:SseB family protein [Clostridiales bacterium]
MSGHVNPKALENGEVLVRLKWEFLKARSREALFPLLCCLRDSVVHVPMNAILSEEDQKRIAGMKSGGHWQNNEEIGLKPDILKAPDGKLWFPVFSRVKEIPEHYKNHFSIIPMKAVECVRIAHTVQDVEGIVLDAFSDTVSLPFQMADIMEQLPSQLPPEEK